ncbi:hypothetical protein CAEBREN_07725 [Caenorhabditis brenneri]|uniref:Uncharacterized protein n=1 Tax=Caenorhabditis brenneri TaxID=135651 RepID=G0ML38_CAEBE|nr:hypothetical protein CAEBREN_07725 [Caenorhabditis brenneri]
MSEEEKTGKEVKNKKSEEKEQPTQQETKSEKSSKSSRIKNKSKIKTAEKIQSLKRNVESSEKKTKKGTKERSKEIDEMPPTADSARSPAPNQKKKKQKGMIQSKTNPQTTASSIPNSVGKSKEPTENGMFPATTPTPDVGPDRKSKAMGVIEMDQGTKKPVETLNEEPRERKKRELKRETNHIYHVRPGINREAEHTRRKEFEQELIKYETGKFTYLTDPTRYHFRLPPSMDIVTQFVLPSLLILAIMLATVTCLIFLEVYIRDENILRENNCPGLIQGPWEELDSYDLDNFRSINPDLTRGVKAQTYRWMPLAETVMQMNFECPPSVILEMSSEKKHHSMKFNEAPSHSIGLFLVISLYFSCFMV